MTDRNRAETVAIIGAGIGGLYLVAELGIAGFKLRLHDIDDSRLSEIRARHGVDVEGERGGFAAVERATNDLRSAVDGADVIIIVTGGNAQATVARSLAPLLRDGQVILLIQGNTGGSLIVRRALDEAGCRVRIDVAEMDNYPYSCWRLSPTRIRRIVRKRWLQIAVFPGNRIGEVFPRLSPLFPEAVAARNVLYTGFTNANAMLHVANCVANAGRIESGDSYKFYAEGVTPAVARLYEAINAERVAVAGALGASVPNLERRGSKLSKRLPATGIIFRETQAEHDIDWHPAPRRQYIINLDAGVKITASDGESRVIGVGEVILVEDTTGKGHLSQHVEGKIRHSIFVPIE